MKKLFPLLFTFILLTGCQQAPAGGSPVAPTPHPTDPILFGPETTPNVLNPYPTTLTVEPQTPEPTPYNPTETATPAATETPSYSETSRYFEPGFQLDLEGNVDGIAVPFSVGLHASIMNWAQEPVKSITVNRPDTNDVYAKFWLTLCWKKYEMQHPEAAGMSFTQYEQLVKAGGGEIQIAAVDERTDDQNNKLLTFHPENGFVHIIADETLRLPEELNTLAGIYFGMNEKGQLVMVLNDFLPDLIRDQKGPPPDGWTTDSLLGGMFCMVVGEDMEYMLSLDNDGLLSSTPYWQKIGQGAVMDDKFYVNPLIVEPIIANKTAFFVIGQ